MLHLRIDQYLKSKYDVIGLCYRRKWIKKDKLLLSAVLASVCIRRFLGEEVLLISAIYMTRSCLTTRVDLFNYDNRLCNDSFKYLVLAGHRLEIRGRVGQVSLWKTQGLRLGRSLSAGQGIKPLLTVLLRTGKLKTENYPWVVRGRGASSRVLLCLLCQAGCEF